MKKLLYDVNERPPIGLWGILSLQHVFAMIGATVLVPIIVGLPVSVALFASGLGTLIYIIATKAKVPVYLGSSFAYIAAILFAKEALGGSIAAAQTGLVVIGLIYVLIALFIKVIGKDWLRKLLPPIVIGPMIIIIGLGLAGWAVTQSGFVAGGEVASMLLAIFTLLLTIAAIIKGKGIIKITPFIVGIVGGSLVAYLTGHYDISVMDSLPILAIPDFKIMFVDYMPYFGPAMWAMIPIALVTISEHIGDHTVLGAICEKDFLQDPGLDKTLIGDGIATSVSAFLGGPANTTYGENTGVIGMTKVASVWVTGGAAVIAIVLSFFGKFTGLIGAIPAPVLGGISMILYGVIASNGLRVLIDAKVDFTKQRNLIIASVMMVIGLGGAVVPFFGVASLSGVALAAIVGILLNLIIPETD